MEPEPRMPRRFDLLRIALAVFFVALIVLVVALLMLPTLAA